MLDKYLLELHKPVDRAAINGFKIGLLYGLAQFTMQSYYGVIFYISSRLVIDETINGIENCLVYTMVIWAGWNIGNNLFFAASFSEGRQAAKSVFALLDSPDED